MRLQSEAIESRSYGVTVQRRLIRLRIWLPFSFCYACVKGSCQPMQCHVCVRVRMRMGRAGGNGDSKRCQQRIKR